MTTTMGRIAAALTPDLDPQPEPDDDARYWLTTRGAIEIGAPVFIGACFGDPTAIVEYVPELNCWGVIR